MKITDVLLAQNEMTGLWATASPQEADFTGGHPTNANAMRAALRGMQAPPEALGRLDMGALLRAGTSMSSGERLFSVDVIEKALGISPAPAQGDKVRALIDTVIASIDRIEAIRLDLGKSVTVAARTGVERAELDEIEGELRAAYLDAMIERGELDPNE